MPAFVLLLLALWGLVPAEVIAICLGFLTMIPGAWALIRVGRVEAKVDGVAQQLRERAYGGGADPGGGGADGDT